MTKNSEERLQSDAQLRIETGRQLDDVHGQLVTCRPDELRPHPSYDRHNLAVSATQLAALGDLAFREPLLITRDRTIVDGYARWKLAQLRDRPTLLCMEHELDETEALQMLLRTHRRLNGFIRFNRIGLALDLKPHFQERARSKQRAHSQRDGSSDLTRVDVRTQIAIEAGVCTGNVTKFDQLMKTAHPKVQQAAQAGDISLNKAWQWSHLSAEAQLKELETYLSQRGTKKAIRRLIRGHVEKRSPSPPPRSSLGDLLRRLSTHESRELDSISVGVIKGAGRFAFLTEEALRMLRLLEN